MKKYFNAENVTTFVIVVLTVIVAPTIFGFIQSAKAKVSGK